MGAVEIDGYTIETGANLEGANLEGANLRETYFEGAIAYRDTIWPEGFDPEAAGVIFED